MFIRLMTKNPPYIKAFKHGKNTPGCHKSIPREKSIVFYPPPARNTTLALPSLLSWCLSWLGIPVGCALPLLCSLNLLLCCSDILFSRKNVRTEVNKTSQKQRESWFAKLPALKNEVMWANISSFYGNLSSSVIYDQWPSRSILDNMKVFLA